MLRSKKKEDQISYLRSKVGHDKVIRLFAGGILENERCS